MSRLTLLIYLITATGLGNLTHKLRLISNSLCCSKETHSKYVLLWQYLAMKFSFIFEFQLVHFPFSLIFGGPFMVAPPKLWEGELFSKESFSWGDKFCGAN